MFTANLQGGLGNQLFQLAFLEYLQKHTGIKYYIRISDVSRQISQHSSVSYFDSIFRQFEEYASDVCSALTFREENLHPKNWIDILNKNSESNILFDGYFQNHNYITQEFIDKLSFDNEVLHNYPDIQNTVFLHVRGGDYVNHHLLHVNLVEYYAKAIDRFPKGTVFSIFTNDIDYTRTIINLNDIDHIIISENEVDSIYLMSKCKGGICANSSFSWWGARLNSDRKLILPSEWFNDPNFYTAGFYFPGATVLHGKMWEFVDKVVYINLDHRTDRNEHMKHMTRTFGNKVTRFSAIKTDYGLIGCCISHIQILKTAIKDNCKNILVLEDDAEWHNFQQGYKTLRKLSSNSYDVIMLGGSFVSHNPDTYKLFSCLTTTGYLVNKHYIQTLISNFEEGLSLLLQNYSMGPYYGLDVYWKRLQQKDNWYIVQPPLVYQLPSYSDIENRLVDYKSFMGIT
jgi:hypothetical protein